MPQFVARGHRLTEVQEKGPEQMVRLRIVWQGRNGGAKLRSGALQIVLRPQHEAKGTVRQSVAWIARRHRAELRLGTLEISGETQGEPEIVGVLETIRFERPGSSKAGGGAIEILPVGQEPPESGVKPGFVR